MHSDSPSLRSLALRRRLLLAGLTLGWVILAAIPVGRIFSHDGWTFLKSLFENSKQYQ